MTHKLTRIALISVALIFFIAAARAVAQPEPGADRSPPAGATPETPDERMEEAIDAELGDALGAELPAVEPPGEKHFNQALMLYGIAVGLALVIVGSSYAISKISSASVEAMARQPEAAGNIQTAMIISTALIEGVTFFALIILLMSSRV